MSFGNRLMVVLYLLAVPKLLSADPCPRLRAPQCPAGQVVVSPAAKSDQDCPKPLCKSCPSHPELVCKKNEIRIFQEDDEGCPKPACILQPESGS